MPEQESNNKRIAKNTLFLYVRMFLVMLISLYTSRVILQVLGIEDFGVYNVVGSIVLMFSFLNGSLSNATSRFITVELGKRQEGDVNKIFNITFICHVLIAGIVVILSETVGLWYFFNKMVIPENQMESAFWVFQISILTAIFSITQIPYSAVIIAHENMKIYAYVGIGEVILKLMTVFMLMLFSSKLLLVYAILQFLVQITIVCYYRFYCIHTYSESKVRWCWDTKLFKEIFSFSSSSMLSSMAVELQSQGINLLLNSFFGPIVNTARAIANQIQGAVNKLSANFTTASRPQIMKLYIQGEIAEMMRLTQLSSRLSFYLMLYFIVPLCLEGPMVLKLWLGSYPAITVSFMIIVLFQGLITTMGTPRVAIFAATGKIRNISIIGSLILASSFPVAYVLFRLGYDASWALIVSCICVFINEAVQWAMLRHYINYSVKDVIYKIYLHCTLILLVSSILPIIIFLNVEHLILRLVLVFCINAVSVTLCVYTMGLNQHYRKKVNSYILIKLSGRKL